MFNKTQAKLNEKYVEPATRMITAALVIAATALFLAFAAFVRSI